MTQIKKSYIYIISIFIAIAIILAVLFLLKFEYNTKPVITLVPNTKNIYIGKDNDNGSNSHQSFSFSISPSGNYLLFIENPTEGTSYDLPTTNLNLIGLTNGVKKNTKVSFNELSNNFSKNCWTQDENNCVGNETLLNEHIFYPYVSIRPSLRYEDIGPGKESRRKKFDISTLSCSDCISYEEEKSIIQNIRKYKGEDFLSQIKFTVSKSGDIYYVNSLQKEGNRIILIDTKTYKEKDIYSANDNIGACLNNLSLSPDEKYIAFSKQATCNSVDGNKELHIYNIEKKKDLIYTNIKITPSDFSWSPDSKTLYFVSFDENKNSVIKSVIL